MPGETPTADLIRFPDLRMQYNLDDDAHTCNGELSASARFWGRELEFERWELKKTNMLAELRVPRGFFKPKKNWDSKLR